MAEETKNQGQQEYAENISGQAKEIISAALEETKNNGTSPVLGDPNVTDNFKGLPMRELIAAPLIAAAEAQQGSVYRIGAYSFSAHRSRGCRFPDGGYRYIKRKKHYQRRSRDKSFCKTLVYKCGNQRQSHNRPREHPHDQPNGKIPDTCFCQPAAADRRSV